jgi:hypothetical protein
VRIVKDVTAADDAKPKKKNRGYAFIVFEREKDMKGNTPHHPVHFLRIYRLLFKVE